MANGQIFRLSDIATVKRTYSDPPQPMFRINGQAAIGIGISMRAGGNVLALGQNVPVATLWAHYQGGDVDAGLAELEAPAGA